MLCFGTVAAEHHRLLLDVLSQVPLHELVFGEGDGEQGILALQDVCFPLFSLVRNPSVLLAQSK